MIIQWSSIEEKGNITVIVSSHNKEVLIYKFNQIAYFSELLKYLHQYNYVYKRIIYTYDKIIIYTQEIYKSTEYPSQM
jgi:hypothetical protein